MYASFKCFLASFEAGNHVLCLAACAEPLNVPHVEPADHVTLVVSDSVFISEIRQRIRVPVNSTLGGQLIQIQTVRLSPCAESDNGNDRDPLMGADDVQPARIHAA